MGFKLCGTQYGGWMIDLDMIPEGSQVISAGVGEDISFDLRLIEERKCEVIGIDPTPKSHAFIENQKKLDNFELVKMALHVTDGEIVSMYKNKRPDHVSESVLPDHHSVNDFDSYFAETISLPSLFIKYDNISLVKMDIEGSEYDVLHSLDSIPSTVKQFCVECHHFCSSKTIQDTHEIIKKITTLGFDKFLEKPGSKKLAEMTFWRE